MAETDPAETLFLKSEAHVPRSWRLKLGPNRIKRFIKTAPTSQSPI